MRTANATGQPTSAPTKKVLAGGVAGATSTILVFILNSYVFQPHHMKELDGGVAAAITTVLSFVVAYLVPPGANETTIQ